MIDLKCGDCLELMKEISDNSIDMILCDLPYSTTKRKTTYNNWDNCSIEINELWKEYKRIIKTNGTIALFGQDLFSAELIVSNHKHYKYKWIWQKEMGTGYLNAKRMPLRDYEEILIFYEKQPTYNPQMKEGKPYRTIKGSTNRNYCSTDKIVETISKGGRYPTTILKYNRDKGGYHPTQKPLKLIEYLIKTYTNENNLVLDNCMGSGTTGVACKKLNRNFIGYEIDEKYFNIAKERIENTEV